MQRVPTQSTSSVQFYVDKVRRIHDNITTALLQSPYHLFAGQTLDQNCPLSTGVRKLLAAMLSKTSPLDVLPCSLLKECANVFAPAITKLANLQFAMPFSD